MKNYLILIALMLIDAILSYFALKRHKDISIEQNLFAKFLFKKFGLIGVLFIICILGSLLFYHLIFYTANTSEKLSQVMYYCFGTYTVVMFLHAKYWIDILKEKIVNRRKHS